MSKQYRVRFFNCQCINLPKFEKDTCNPYVNIRFNNKKYVTPKRKKSKVFFFFHLLAINPVWPNYEFKHKYSHKTGISLRDRFLTVTVLHSSTGFLNKDVIIGSVRVDLYTIATGPIDHRLRLLNPKTNEDSGGVVKFSFSFTEFSTITMEFRDLQVLDLKYIKPSSSCKFYVEVKSLDKRKIESDLKKVLIFDKCKSPLTFETTTFRDFKHEILYVNVMCKNKRKRECIGSACLELKKYLKANLSEKLEISLGIKDLANNTVIGDIRFVVYVKGAPKYTQMSGGEHTDFNVHGESLFSDSLVPDEIKQVFRHSCGDIKTYITIDLGTTHSGYSYCTEECDDISKINIHMSWGEGNFKYKNKSSILYENYKPMFWGFKAVSQYNIKRKTLKKKTSNKESPYTLIQDFKLSIHKNKDIVINGRTFGIEKVVSDFLGLMRKDILEELEKQNFCLDEKSVKWILTVPAIWNDNDKNIMKNAAINSGIILPGVNDDDDHFTFALEPESASLPCLLYENATIQPKTKFLVLDAGGGTIDIAVYETVVPPDGTKFGIRQLRSASGGAAGGKFINDRFLLFIKQLVSENEYQSIISSYDIEHLMANWEAAKLQFNVDQMEDDIFISLPNNLNSVISKIRALKYYYEADEGDLVIPGELFFEIYRAPVEKTIDYVKEEMKRLNNDIQYIFMVGGFSDSPILYNEVKKNFSKSCKVIKIPQPGIRVLQGATWYGKYPKIISSRCSSYSYIAMINNDSEKNLFFTNLGKRCKHNFFVMAKAGEIIETGKKFKIEVEMNGVHGILDIFATDQQTIKKIGAHECKKILSINLRFNRKMKKLKLHVNIVFGEVEIKFEVVNPKSGKQLASSKYNVTFDAKGGIVDRKEEEITERKLLSFNKRPKRVNKPKRPARRKINVKKRSQQLNLPQKPLRSDSRQSPRRNKPHRPASKPKPRSKVSPKRR